MLPDREKVCRGRAETAGVSSADVEKSSVPVHTPLSPLVNGVKALFHPPMHSIHHYHRKLKHFAYEKHFIRELCRLVVNRIQK
jgi:hypothetical protein